MPYALRRVLLILLLALLLGCGGPIAAPTQVPAAQTPAAALPTTSSSQDPTQAPGETAVLAEPASPTPLATALPTVKATTEPTAGAVDEAATAVVPPPPGTSWAQPGGLITLDTLSSLVPLQTLGYGKAEHAAIAPDNSLLAVATTAGLALFELPALSLRRFDPIPAGAHRVVFSEDGTHLNVSTGSHYNPLQLELRRVDDGAIVQSEPAVFELKTVTYPSPSGAFMAALHPLDSVATPHVEVRRVADDTLIYSDELTEEVSFSDDSTLVALIAYDGTVRVLNLLDGTVSALDLPSVWSVAFSPDGRSLIAGGRTVRRFALADGGVQQIGEPHFANNAFLNGATQRASYSADGSVLTVEGEYAGFEHAKRLASAWRAGETSFAHLWDIDVWGIGFMNYETYVGAASPASNMAAITNDGQLLELHLGDTQVVTHTVPAGVSGLAFSPDGRLLAIGDVQGQIQLVTADASGQVVQTLAVEDAPTELVFSPDGALLSARGASGRALIWDIAKGREVATFVDQPAPARENSWPRLLISADHSMLLAWSQSGVRIYRLAGEHSDRALLHTIDSPSTSVALDPQRRWLAILQNEQVTLWGVR